MRMRAVSCWVFSVAVLWVWHAGEVQGDIAPRRGTFSGYYFVDRWGQGVFDYFFVEPEAAKRLGQGAWGPVRLTTEKIVQPENPGAAMIHEIGAVEALPEPFGLRISVYNERVEFDKQTRMRIEVTNTSDQSIDLSRRQLRLLVTVHRRGTHPEERVQRDAIYDCLTSRYGIGLESDARRATMSVPLFASRGAIVMRNGGPALLVRDAVELRRANLYDEQPLQLPPGKSHESVYTIGGDWLVNEYELQLRYHLRDREPLPYVLSPPVRFDVADE